MNSPLDAIRSFDKAFEKWLDEVEKLIGKKVCSVEDAMVSYEDNQSSTSYAKSVKKN